GVGRPVVRAADDANGPVDLTVSLTDDGGTDSGGSNTSAPVTRSITVSPVNDAPSFTAGTAVAVTEDAGTVVLAGWATSIAAGPADESGQVLSFTVLVDDASLFAAVPSIDAASGDLSFVLAGDANGSATMTISVADDGGTASSGVDTSPTVSRGITVSASNDPPVAIDDFPTVDEDTVAGVTFAVLGDDTDVDGDTLVYGSADTSTVAEGTITDHLDGTFTYVPHEHFNGTETFTYVVSDGNGGTDTGLVTITVNPVADNPVAVDDSRITPVDTPLVVTAPGLLSNDYDVDGETVTVTGASAPSNGAVGTNPDGSYTYTPGSGFVGTATFTYFIQDASGATDSAVATITVDSGVSTDTYYLGDSGSSVENYDLVASPPPSSNPVFDSDGDGDPGLTILEEKDESETDPDKFQLWTLATATPLDLDGPVTLDLWSAFVNFETGQTGHPYIWLYDCASGGGSCTTLTETDVHTDDWDQGIANFSNRQVDLGSVTHTVAAGRELVLRLQFDHQDMWVAMTADFPSALELTLANAAPTANDDTDTVNEDAATTNLDVLANDVDDDLDTTSVSITVPAGSGTATALGDGTIDYTPDPDTSGLDTFTYEVCDLGGLCDTATVSVTVNPVNDQPSFTGGLASITGGMGPNTMPAWATAIDPGAADEAGQVLTFVVVTNTNPGMFSAGPTIDVGTGDMTFTVTGTGTANITIELQDDGGTANGGSDTSGTFSFAITVP
ncbi:MAG: Ig-like domain-containing protein, partial [Actinomycetota bacterium]